MCVRGEEGSGTQNTSGSLAAAEARRSRTAGSHFPPCEAPRGLCPAARRWWQWHPAASRDPPTPAGVPLPGPGNSSAPPHRTAVGTRPSPVLAAGEGRGGDKGMLPGAVSRVLLLPSPRETWTPTQKRLWRRGRRGEAHGEQGHPSAVRRRGVPALFEAGCAQLSKGVGRALVSACCISSSQL